VTVRSGGDDTNVAGILNSSNDTGSQNNFLPGLANVNDVNTIRATFPHVRLHMLFTILGSDVGLGREEELDILLGSFEDRGQF